MPTKKDIMVMTTKFAKIKRTKPGLDKKSIFNDLKIHHQRLL